MASPQTRYNGKYVPGLNRLGKLRFSLKNKQMFDLAVSAFNKYSAYKNNTTHLNYFLQTLEITSSLEGGFDGMNTWDRAGISFGFIGFAFPNGEAFKLLNVFNPTLANKVKNAYGPVAPYEDAKSMAARVNLTLIDEVLKAIVTPQGIEAQFKLCIETFYDKAYTQFLKWNFKKELRPTALGFEEGNKNFLYANSLIFDVIVNQGVGKVGRFNPTILGSVTEGVFLTYFVEKTYLRPERRTYWRNIINTNFIGYNPNTIKTFPTK